MALTAKQVQEAIDYYVVKRLESLPILVAFANKLKLVEHVNRICPGETEIPHGEVALILGLNRLQAPKPLYSIADWYQQTILPELLTIPNEQLYDVRLGRTLDALHPHREKIWQAVATEAIRNFGISSRFLHYDITSIYFEGEYKENELIQYGYSRDGKNDCKQLNLGLTVAGDGGVPVFGRVLSGNTADKTTPLENLKALKKVFESDARLRERLGEVIVVSDCAMVSPEVIVTYDRQGIGFIAPLQTTNEVKALLQNIALEKMQMLSYRPKNQKQTEPNRYFGLRRLFPVTHDGATVDLTALVVYSTTKAKLDRQHRGAKMEKYETQLTAIKEKLNTRRYKKRAYVEQRLAKIRQGNSYHSLFNIELTGKDGALCLTFCVDPEKLSQNEALDGKYLLATNRGEQLSDEDILRNYKNQDTIEKRFSLVKGPIKVRPVFLEKPERIESLVLLCMIALLIYALIDRQARKTLGITAKQMFKKLEGLALSQLCFIDGTKLWLDEKLSPSQIKILKALACENAIPKWIKQLNENSC